MSCTHLPVELIDAIFEHLHDDSRSLAACSLVCWAWVHSARRHLFADANLDRAGVEKLVKSKTAAIPFIQRLRLTGDFDQRFWTETYPTLVDFQNVRSLSFEFLPWNPIWSKTQSIYIERFSSVVHLRLRQIHVAEFFQLTEIICAFPRLKTLVVDQVFWLYHSSANPNPSTFGLPHSQLRALELRQCQIDLVLQWFLSFERIPPLHAVYLHGIIANFADVLDEFLQALGPSLAVFMCDMVDFDGIGAPINFSNNTSLRTLRLELCRPTGVVNVRKTLSQITSTRMEEVHFTFERSPTNYFVEEWDKVDKILTQPPFSDLRKVEIAYKRSPGLSAQHVRDLKVWAVTHLPRCSFRGILDFRENFVERLLYL